MGAFMWPLWGIRSLSYQVLSIYSYIYIYISIYSPPF